MRAEQLLPIGWIACVRKENAFHTTEDLFLCLHSSPTGRYLKATVVVGLLKKSGLPDSVLKVVWKEAKAGPPFDKMNGAEFVKACQLVAERKASGSTGGAAGPAVAGNSVSVAPVGTAARTALPGSTAKDEALFLMEWSNATPSAEGLLPAAAAAAVFKKSKLPESELRQIWTKSKQGPPADKMNQQEFLKACRMVTARRRQLGFASPALQRKAGDTAGASSPAPAPKSNPAPPPSWPELEALMTAAAGGSGALLNTDDSAWAEAHSEIVRHPMPA